MQVVSAMEVEKLKKDIELILGYLQQRLRSTNTGMVRSNEELKRLWTLYEEARKSLCELDANLFKSLRELSMPSTGRELSVYAESGDETHPEGTEVFYVKDLRSLENELIRAISYIGILEKNSAAKQTRGEPINILRLLSSRFHKIARQLRTRHLQRPTLDVEDEYDVQDLLHSLLQIHFDDIRPEEWTPIDLRISN